MLKGLTFVTTVLGARRFYPEYDFLIHLQLIEWFLYLCVNITFAGYTKFSCLLFSAAF